MDVKKVNVYEACDRAIQAMNREALKDFGKLKLAKWDELHIIRTVTTVYRESAKKARKRYYEVAFEAYVLGLLLCDIPPDEAHRMAEKAITMEWVDKYLEQTDFVTLYRFDTETERKAHRLAEALEGTQERNAEIDKAIRLWSRQLGQYAINFTDYAMLDALMAAGTEWVQWVTMRDERVCSECRTLDGQIFPADEFPPKPHWGCRCRMRPVAAPEE